MIQRTLRILFLGVSLGDTVGGIVKGPITADTQVPSTILLLYFLLFFLDERLADNMISCFMAENAKEQRDGQNMKILQKMIDEAEKTAFFKQLP